MLRRTGLVVLSLLAIAPLAEADAPPRLVIVPVATEPPASASVQGDLAALRQEVAAHPDDRTKRVALVRGLLRAKDLDGALVEARAWRAKDAYNLVAVRALGDVYMERGEKDEAERVYSAIVELLPRDLDAQRALATILKQRGDLPAAEERLLAAVSARPDDPRLLLELADVEQRIGKREPAGVLLGKVVAGKETTEQIRYPAKLRLAQIYGEERREARAKKDDAAAADATKRLEELELKGGIENDIHVYLTWDTDRTDVDLWVVAPSGEKVFYGHKNGKGGEALFDDVTTGYGPESLTVKRAPSGAYKVQVNYFGGGRGAFPEARGEVTIVLDEGRPTERRQVLPYRLFAEKDTVTVAEVRVGGGT